MSDIFTPRFELDSPYLADYFGLWMIHADPLQAMVNRINGTNLTVHMTSPDVQSMVESRDSALYQVDGKGIAFFDVTGPMMKAVPSMAEGTSYLRMRQQFQAAKRDPEVKGGLMRLDTPGGTAKGNEDAVKAAADFAAAKPLFSFTEDMTASAGVSIASQATKRFANNATATYGAMGTFAVIQDVSGLAEKLGVKVHVIKAGDFKGMGTAGAPVTEEQIEELQRVVNTLNENYLSLIASGLGRSVDSIRLLADGRVIMASDAVTAGLINGVQSLDQTIQELHDTVSSKTQVSVPTRRESMAEKTPATLQELKSTFPNSSAEWRETQQEAGNDLGASAIAYAQHVEAKAKADAETHQKELEEAKKAQSTFAGHEPLSAENSSDGSGIESGDAVADFHSAVAERLPRGRSATGEERSSAIAYVARVKPGLHQAYIMATNAEGGAKVKRMVQEKYESAVA